MIEILQNNHELQKEDMENEVNELKVVTRQHFLGTLFVKLCISFFIFLTMIFVHFRTGDMKNKSVPSTFPDSLTLTELIQYK